MTTVYLIRHAEAEGNVYRRCHGQYDALLTTRAYEQLPYLAARFEQVPLDAVYASDLYRARHTAKAIADRKGMKVRVRRELREIRMGAWEDRTWAVLPRIAPEMYAIWQTKSWDFRLPDSETVMECGDRVLSGLRRLAREWDGKTIAVVSHGSAIRGILCRTLGYRPEQIGEVGWGDNTCVAKFEFDGDEIRPIYWNDASHLPQELSTFALIGWKDTKGAPQTVQAWFRDYDPSSEADRALVLDYARDFYRNAYGTVENLNEAAWLAATDEMAKTPRAVTLGFVNETPAALVRLNVLDQSEPDTGKVGSFVIREEFRGRGLSQQILGQAISVYRAMGKDWLCAYVAAENGRARGFYDKFGFENRGEVVNENGLHYKMCKRIKVDTVAEEADDFILED